MLTDHPVKFDLPKHHVLNEAWGGMSRTQYERAVVETPQWKLWAAMLFCLPHPYAKYAKSNPELLTL